VTTYDEQVLFPNEESSPAVSLAKTFPWQAVAQAWMEHAQDCFGKSPDSSKTFNPVGSFSKTSLDSCQVSPEQTWLPSSGRWLNSGMGTPTELWTLKTLESPNDGGEYSSSLENILEPPTALGLAKYYLSHRAAQGILRRATRRGKTLPEPLMQALQAIPK
jgi:hypothetical protein